MTEFEKTFLDYYKDLDDLQRRLQDDYNGDAPFEQDEQDRLALGMLLDEFDKKVIQKIN